MSYICPAINIKMTISELIEKLEDLKSQEGDLNVCITENHEVWGTADVYLYPHMIVVDPDAKPKGINSKESEKALVFRTPPY